MTIFSAHVQLRLRAPMKVEGSNLDAIVLATDGPWRGRVTLIPRLEGSAVKAVAAVVEIVEPRAEWKAGMVMLAEPSGRVLMLAPDHLASRALASALTAVAATTLQAELIRGLDDLAWYVESWEWELPDGKRVRPPKSIASWSYFLSEEIPASRAVLPHEWAAVPPMIEGAAAAPLWRSIMLDGYQARWRGDLAGTVLRAATALEVGVGEFFETDFNVQTLHRHTSVVAQEPLLAAAASELWYSRHGIIHRGQTALYRGHPKRTQPSRPLCDEDGARFLDVVPLLVAFVAHDVESRRAKTGGSGDGSS